MNTIELKSKKLVAALLAAGVLGGMGATAVDHMNTNAFAQPVPVAAAVAPATQTLPSFTAITSRNGPAVVNISTSGMQSVSDDDDDGAAAPQARPGRGQQNPMDEWLRQFGFPPGAFGQMPGQQGSQQVPVRGQGSGFIISPDGLIMTNAHVVRGAKDVTVKLTDRREFKAKVLGADPKTDIAVLKIDARGLPTVPLGSSKNLQPGEWVLAIGSPFGFENSVTAGVVSAKGRSLPDDSAVPFIQTDVAVNPGNSGGPLFNSAGEVVGINSQIYSRSGGYQGLSFSIPIELAVRVKDQIVATGKVEHARLGVTVQEINQAFADSFKLPKPEGALVANVEKGSAAEKAGLKTGDVILRANGQPIVSSGDLPAQIGMVKPGDTVALDVWRGGHAEQLTAKLSGDKGKTERLADAANVQKGKLGLSLRPLSPQEKQQAHVEGGLLIEQTAGPAAMAGVQPGDVLMSINGQPVNSAEQASSVIAKSDKSVALLIQRDGERIFVPVRIG
ncbi:DegQ family serine endoprotease [Ottowia sp. VDI28]|uniref:DegQ family serine endoprotease n=1 Tax=Ottowia sp. VDI28 TaxID=3133968 RepID=UPI003C2EF2FB